jgi:hypothetical protein
MTSTAADTRKAQDDPVKSFYNILAFTRSLAEKRISEHKKQRTDLLDTADIARRLLGDWVDQTAGIDGFQKVHEEELALAQAHVLICEELGDNFVGEWKMVGNGSLEKRQGVVTRAMAELNKLDARYNPDVEKVYQDARQSSEDILQGPTE